MTGAARGRRTAAWLGSFAWAIGLYATIWIVFTALRSLADGTLLAQLLAGDVPSAERAVFHGQLPTVQLQERFFDANHLRWWDYAATFVHWSFFVAPHLTAVLLWLTDPSRFRRWRRALGILLGMGAAIYALLPTDPPWLAPDALDTPATATPYRIMTTVGAQLGGGLYHASYRVIGESNPLAAMPSIHFAVTALLVFALWDYGWRWRFAASAYAAAMALSLIYLGEHYVLDVAAGLAVTAYAWFIAGAWGGIRDRRRSHGVRRSAAETYVHGRSDAVQSPRGSPASRP